MRKCHVISTATAVIMTHKTVVTMTKLIMAVNNKFKWIDGREISGI